jgi:hypothetical protein
VSGSFGFSVECPPEQRRQRWLTLGAKRGTVLQNRLCVMRNTIKSLCRVYIDVMLKPKRIRSWMNQAVAAFEQDELFWIIVGIALLNLAVFLPRLLWR